uniref:Uncharacterized protein n=1 Tax=Knipowitschia caucasica TaxID=637954 RepID=A0AAV2MHQ4_KNICA
MQTDTFPKSTGGGGLCSKQPQAPGLTIRGVQGQRDTSAEMKTAAVILLLLGVALYSAHAKNCKGKDMKVEVVSAVLSPEHDDVKTKESALLLNVHWPLVALEAKPPSGARSWSSPFHKFGDTDQTPRGLRSRSKLDTGEETDDTGHTAKGNATFPSTYVTVTPRPSYFLPGRFRKTQSKSSRNHMLMDCVTGLKSGFRWCQKLGVKLYYKIKC